MNQGVIFTAALVALALVPACGGRVVVDLPGENGGGGTGGMSAGDGNGGGFVSSGTASNPVTSSGNGSGCTSAAHCAEAITPGSGVIPPDLCGDSHALYAALTDCVCAGACATACGGDLCIDKPASQACGQCVQNASTGCGAQLDACVNDV